MFGELDFAVHILFGSTHLGAVSRAKLIITIYINISVFIWNSNSVYIYSRWTKISKIAAVIFVYVGKLKIDYASRPDMGSRDESRADMEKVMY